MLPISGHAPTPEASGVPWPPVWVTDSGFFTCTFDVGNGRRCDAKSVVRARDGYRELDGGQ